MRWPSKAQRDRLGLQASSRADTVRDVTTEFAQTQRRLDNEWSKAPVADSTLLDAFTTGDKLRGGTNARSRRARRR